MNGFLNGWNSGMEWFILLAAKLPWLVGFVAGWAIAIAAVVITAYILWHLWILIWLAMGVAFFHAREYCRGWIHWLQEKRENAKWG